MNPESEIKRLQDLIDRPDCSEVLKVAYLAEKTEWVKKLPGDFCSL